MKLNAKTAGALGVFCLAVLALGAWGDRLGMEPSALEAVRSAAALVGGAVLAVMRSLLSTDANGNGVPDVVEK